MKKICRFRFVPRLLLVFLIGSILILNLGIVSFASNVNNVKIKIEGLLTEATKNYIAVDGYEYSVTDKTVVSDINFPKDEFPYDPKSFSHKQEVKIIVENNVVKKIFIRIPQ